MHSEPEAALPGPLFDPVGRGLDLLGDRWTLVLVRHLLGGARGFQELKGRTGIAPPEIADRGPRCALATGSARPRR